MMRFHDSVVPPAAVENAPMMISMRPPKRKMMKRAMDSVTCRAEKERKTETIPAMRMRMGARPANPTARRMTKNTNPTRSVHSPEEDDCSVLTNRTTSWSMVRVLATTSAPPASFQRSETGTAKPRFGFTRQSSAPDPRVDGEGFPTVEPTDPHFNVDEISESDVGIEVMGDVEGHRAPCLCSNPVGAVVVRKVAEPGGGPRDNRFIDGLIVCCGLCDDVGDEDGDEDEEKGERALHPSLTLRTRMMKTMKTATPTPQKTMPPVIGARMAGGGSPSHSPGGHGTMRGSNCRLTSMESIRFQ